MTKVVLEGEVVKKSEAKSGRTRAKSTKTVHINGLVAIIVAVLVICAAAWILKFAVGVLSWLLQFVIVLAALALVFALVYQFLGKGSK
jgi:cobalamin biosynthesis protein CobD/CbiB